MVTLNNVTLVSVTSVNVDRTIKALMYSNRGIQFNKVLLITDKDVTPDGISVINIPKLDYIGYSRFIVYELHKHIETEFALIIQEDGFVINPKAWTSEFLKYDYIGAPFPIPNDNFSYRDPFGNLIRVGNGGFSLRSKKILELPTKLNLEWKSYFGYYNEDGFFAVHNRYLFEKEGCNFAPVELAAQFSIENKTSETKNIIPFGFHGKTSSYNNLI